MKREPNGKPLLTPDANLAIEICDECGAGGAHHIYRIGASQSAPVVEGAEDKLPQLIGFQQGPIFETGVNGVTNEVLLEIVKHRLECFQAGPYPCPENQRALAKIGGALEALRARTAARRQRGVEGKNEV